MFYQKNQLKRYRMVVMVRNIEVSDTTADAMKNESW